MGDINHSKTRLEVVTDINITDKLRHNNGDKGGKMIAIICIFYIIVTTYMIWLRTYALKTVTGCNSFGYRSERNSSC